MSDVLLTENRDGVLQVTLNRPEKKNAINIPMWEAIRDTFRSAAEDEAVTCVLLTGAGDNFSSGVDLSSFTEGGDGERQHDEDTHNHHKALHDIGPDDGVKPAECRIEDDGHAETDQTQ